MKPSYLLLLLPLLAASSAAAADNAANTANRRSPPRPTAPSVAFEGSALLITYYAGASWALRKGGIIRPRSTTLSGLSGGAYTATLNTLGLTGPEQREFWIESVQEIATRFAPNSAGYLNVVMEEKLPAIIPATGLRTRLNGKVRVALSQLDGSKTVLKDSASWVVNDFADQADLISALTGTDYISCFSGRHTYTLFRNSPVIDGGYGNGFEQLCPNGRTETGACIKVASWFVGDKADATCDATRCKKLAISQCKSNDRTDRVTRLYKVSCVFWGGVGLLALAHASSFFFSSPRLFFLHTPRTPKNHRKPTKTERPLRRPLGPQQNCQQLP
jgi:hypothetical protein